MEPDYDPNDHDAPSKNTSVAYFVLAVAAVIAVAGVLIWVMRAREIRERGAQQ